MLEGGTPKTHNNTKGLVRGFDVRTGKRLWTFNTIPRPGEFGNDTWLNDSWAVNGNVGVWNQIAVDEELGLAYLPVETPSSDFYGGLRPGNNLFAESIVAIDYKTGQRKWHFQLVHHPIWNMDIAAAPMLVDLTVERPAGQGGRGDGQAGDAVSVQSRDRRADLSDRGAAGAAVRRAGREDVADAAVSDQAAAVRSPGRHAREPDRLHAGAARRGAEDRGALQDSDRSSRRRRSARRKGRSRGFRSSGGTNWPGGSYDPETHIAYVPSFTAMPVLGLLPPPSKEFSDLPYVSGNALTGVRYISGPGENVGADAPPLDADRRRGARSSTTGDAATNAERARRRACRC